MEPILVAKDVEKIYKNLAGEEFYALNHVSMEIGRKSLTILRGRSGSGKTTMLNMMSALDLPDKGVIICEGTQINVTDAVLDRAGRVQLSKENLSAIGVTDHKVKITVKDGQIIISA